MHLSFSPPLGSVSTVALPFGTDGTIVFKAAFASAKEFEEARKANVRVELWTNLPVHSDGQEWGALAFHDIPPCPRSDRDSERSTLAGEGWHLSLQVPFTRQLLYPSKYFCTYRLVHPSGFTEWLGTYGQDATLIFENKHPRIQLCEGWSSALKGRIFFTKSSSSELSVGQLDTRVKWTVWTIAEDGRPTFQRGLREINSCRRVIFFPQWQVEDIASTQPLLLVCEPGSSVRLTPTGEVVCKAGERGGLLQLHSFHSSSVDLLLDDSHAAGDRHLMVLKHDAHWAVLAYRPCTDIGLTQLAIIALQGLAEGDQSTVISLPLDSLRAVLPGQDLTSIAAFDSARGDAQYLNIELHDTLHCHVGPYGAHITLAAVHFLGKGPMRFSLLSSHDLSSIRILEAIEGSLPTPPPSPPAMRSATVSPSIPAPSEYDKDPAYPLDDLAGLRGDALKTLPDESSPRRLLADESSDVARSRTTRRQSGSSNLLRRAQNFGASRSIVRLFFATLGWVFRAVFRRIVFPLVAFLAPPIARAIEGALSSPTPQANGKGKRPEPIPGVRAYPVYRSTRSRGLTSERTSSSGSLPSSGSLISDTTAVTSPESSIIIAPPQSEATVYDYRKRTSTAFSAKVHDMPGSLSALVKTPAPSLLSDLSFRLDGTPLPPPRITNLKGSDIFLVEMNTHSNNGLLEVVHHV